MTKVGIDTLGFYTSQYALDLSELAHARQIDPDKFSLGLGQHKMAVPPPGEDVVTMGANAAFRALRHVDRESIEMVLFATESGVDQSKAAGIYLHHLLNLPARCRVIELKQACYSATVALQLALSFLRQYPEKRVLLVASDVARYGLRTTGESSQGCGAVAMVLSTHPRILAFEPEYGVITEHVMDFWRPNYSDIAFVDGKYSSKLYLNMLEKSWKQYFEWSGRGLLDHAYICYHSPVPKLVEKAHQHLFKLNGETLTDEALKRLNLTLDYGRKIGNSYTASLYVGLTALLDLASENLSGQRIGFYSYGSGCVAEFFSGVVQPTYQTQLDTEYHTFLLNNRTSLSYGEYETFYSYPYTEDGQHQAIPKHKTGQFRLAAIDNHKRVYETVT